VKRWRSSFLVALVGLASLLPAGCKSGTSPSTVGTINITNSSGTTILVYLDGNLELTLDSGAAGTISNVTPGAHELVAKRSDNGFLLDSRTIDVTAGGVYGITINGAASLLITNNYMEILSIYQDQVYIGDIGSQISETLYEISFGTHVYQAESKWNGTVVATTTIDFTNTIQYTWVISP
jgi:hypothetical protein